jgi:hypothetical protein
MRLALKAVAALEIGYVWLPYWLQDVLVLSAFTYRASYRGWAMPLLGLITSTHTMM